MTPSPAQPFSNSRIFSWVAGSFLFGVSLHSVFLDAFVSPWVIVVAVTIGCAALLAGSKTALVTLAAASLLGCVFGWWCFDTARPTMPRGLKPFVSSGLASSPSTIKSSNGLIVWLSQSRERLTKRAATLFPPDEAGLLTGILYGERGLTKNVKTDMRMAGLMHLVAVSGTNVTIIVVLFMRFLALFRLPKKWSFWVVTIGIILFVLFVDPSAAVVRAAIMGWLVELAPLVGRLVRPMRLLLIAATAFTLWHPWALFYDAGFALSFLAMWGLMTWSALFDERLAGIIPWEGTRQLIAATAGATIMTVPYSLWAFGQLTAWGLVTSLVAIPLVPWIMTTGFLSLLIPSMVTTLPALGFLKILLWIGRWPRITGVGYWKNISTPFWVLLVAYACVYLLWRQCQRRKRIIHREVAYIS